MIMGDQQSGEHSPEFEKKIINQIATAAIIEQRRARRWGVFFKFSMLVYATIFALIYFLYDAHSGGVSGTMLTTGKHTALIDVYGVISADSKANSDDIAGSLRAAFEDNNTVGIILRINSPGGSPVQAGYINDEINRLRVKYPDIPFYAVITDICASGGYYIATAADKIYADKASIVGSIGVLISSFGFVDMLEKIGIERRLLHAGENKGFLDPFSSLQEEDSEHAQALIENVHQQFIDVVKQGRGSKLLDEEKIFSGLVWTGEQSIALGLIDDLGSAGYVAREIIGEENIVDFTKQEDFFEQFSEQIGVTFAQTIKTILFEFELR